MIRIAGREFYGFRTVDEAVAARQRGIKAAGLSEFMPDAR
jgi:hypothetical protein